MKKKNLVIIGANEFQDPLIHKAKALGYTTHVFAWQARDVGEYSADYFYPVSIIENERILNICRLLEPVGVCSIGSDLASVTVNYLAEKLGLIGNGTESAMKATNKHLMRRAFEEAGLPSCKSCLAEDGASFVLPGNMRYPLIVKPTDRSGSRGIFKVEEEAQLYPAIDCACQLSFEKKALVEEFAQGREYSIEYISWQGEHHFLACTEKFTTGAPLFIETGHLQPPLHMNNKTLYDIKALVPQVLDALGVKYGASHTELKIDEDGSIKLIECGARMGGDCIGSHLVEISTGIDFVKACAEVACGIQPRLQPEHEERVSAIRFIFSEKDLENMGLIQRKYPEAICHIGDIVPFDDRKIADSAARYGFYILSAATMPEMLSMLSELDLDLN